MLGEIEKYASKEIELFGRRRAAVEAITAAEQAAGLALLDATEGETTNGPVEQITRAKSELAAINAAITACRQRRLQAIREKRQNDAAELRKQAADLKEQSERITAKVSEHLAAVATMEETGFMGLSVAMGHDFPLSQRLQTQAEVLESRAVDLEHEPPKHGTVDIDGATSFDELIAALSRFEGEIPPVQSIVDWATSVEERSGQHFGDLERRVYLSWKDDGRIDLDTSYILVPGLMKIREGVSYGTQYPDVASGTFGAE